MTEKLTERLQQTINYLVSQNKPDFSYTSLIEKLQIIQEQIKNTPLKVILVSHQQQLIDFAREKLESQLKQKVHNFLLTTNILPKPLKPIIDRHHLILLVLDAKNSLSKKEEELIIQAIANKFPFGLIIKQTDNFQFNKLQLKQEYQSELNIWEITQDDVDSYHNYFLLSLLNKSTSRQLLKFNQQINQTIEQYFARIKGEHWQNIKQLKTKYLLGDNLERVQQLINQLPHRCNRLAQNYLRVCKQINNQNKLFLVNSFASDSLMYQVQDAIQKAEVTSRQEKQEVYLQLTIKKENHISLIHLYTIELCQQFLQQWLTEEWQNILTQYYNGGLNRLREQLQAEIEPLANLVPEIQLISSPIKPQFFIKNYICVSALANNSQITFDYHYTQSTWFRLLVAILIGTIIYLLFQRWFGFILLFVQIINLITGQDVKTNKLRQQTKEIKRIIDNKYQNLVRLLADRLTQEIAIAIDDINQDYQEQIEQILQAAAKKLQEIKQDIYLHKEQIEAVKKNHLQIQQIFQQE